MNKYKLEYVSYDIYNYTKLNEYFKQKAQSGWLVTKAMGKWILFKKIKPQTLYFNVDLISKSSFYRYDTLPEIQEYIALCEASSWHYITYTGCFYIFTSTTPNIPPLQTDDYITTKTILEFQPSQYYQLFLNIVLLALFMAFFVKPINFHILENYYFILTSTILLLGCGRIIHLIKKIIQIQKYKKSIKTGMNVEVKPIKNNTQNVIFIVMVYELIKLIYALLIHNLWFLIIGLLFDIYVIIILLICQCCYNVGYYLAHKGLKKHYLMLLTFILVSSFTFCILKFQPFKFIPNILPKIEYKNYLKFDDKYLENCSSYYNYERSKTMWINDYSYYYQHHYTNIYNNPNPFDVELEERYYKCEKIKLANIIFNELSKERNKDLSAYEKLDASKYQVDRIYILNNEVFIMQKQKQVLLLKVYEGYDLEQLKEVVNIYMN